MIEHLVIGALLSFLVVIAVGIIVLRDLLAAVVLLGLYSLVAAGAFVVMDAVDVAFTEAAVGAGISTILFLGALSFTSHEQKPRGNDSVVALVFVAITGALLIYGTLDMPHYGSATSPAQTHPELAVRFIERSAGEVGPPNVVTSVLASYRGYDTLGETVVVFAAGIAVLSLLGLRRRPSSADAPPDAPGDVPSAGEGDVESIAGGRARDELASSAAASRKVASKKAAGKKAAKKKASGKRASGKGKGRGRKQ